MQYKYTNTDTMPLKQRSTYSVAQKLAQFLYALTLPNIDRFSQLFYCQNQKKICNDIMTKGATTSQVCRYTTL